MRYPFAVTISDITFCPIPSHSTRCSLTTGQKHVVVAAHAIVVEDVENQHVAAVVVDAGVDGAAEVAVDHDDDNKSLKKTCHQLFFFGQFYEFHIGFCRAGVSTVVTTT